MKKMTKKQVEREMFREIDNEFSKDELIKLLTGVSREYTELLNWLHKEHKEMLDEFDKFIGRSNVRYVGGKKGGKSR